MKNLIAVFFGGESNEHDISVITGIQVINAVDKEKYEVLPIYVNKHGKMFSGNFYSVDSVKNYKEKKRDIVNFDSFEKKIKVGKKYKEVFCAILCFPGGLGEGGGFSAILEMMGIPYSASNVLASAVGMDKNTQKILAKNENIAILPYVKLDRCSTFEYVDGEKYVVKPNASGSSIGVSAVTAYKEMQKALDLAFTFDSGVLVERMAENFIELNIAAIKENDKILLSFIEKPKKAGEVLSFDDKYLSNSKVKGSKKTSGMAGLSREIPAIISRELEEKIKEYTVTLYKAFGLFGVCRFDYIVEKDVVYFNEVNTIPGSFSFYLWEEKERTFKGIIDIIITESVARKQKSDEITRIINTGVL